MITEQKQHAPSLQEMFAPMLKLLGRLTQQLREGLSGDTELEDMRFLLETLPLTTEQFGLATNRIQNAYRYFKASERGAAKWELNALREQLRHQLELQDAEHVPNRRRGKW